MTRNENKNNSFSKIADKNVGKLDMVIAFDTTGSMAEYIGAVREEVSELIPKLFKNNEDLRLGIVAFGDYCDMTDAFHFGDAYQCLEPTNDVQRLVGFVKESRNTGGGDSDEFYELVLRKIIDETPWRDGSTRSILLIADAAPHPLGYSFDNYVSNNDIDWRMEAAKAENKGIKVDTISITDEPWYVELSKITGGVHLPFSTGRKTARLVETVASARGSEKSRIFFDACESSCNDEEMKGVYSALRSERESYD